MSVTKTKPTVTTRATESAKAKTEDDARVIDHVSQALEAAQGDLASIGGSLGAGARDLRKDVERLLRDARRDLKKMSKALQRDLEQLQKDLTKTAAKNGHAAGKHGGASASTKAKS
jgi:ATP-dependent Clp protease ATP-binding subunit ClpA